MRAMVLKKPKCPLELLNAPIPEPKEEQILIRVLACGVCRTDLHIFDGELEHPKLPLILGHQIVGIVEKLGPGTTRFKIGQRIGVPWLGQTCHTCKYCQSNQENLCDHAVYTGYQINGGFAEYAVAHEDFCFLLNEDQSPLHQAPLLCGGLIGYRALRFTENAKRIGFYGFGSSAHIMIQVARHQERDVYVFTRKGDLQAQQLAKDSGATWVGSSDEIPPQKLDAAIIFAPDGDLVVKALKDSGKSAIIVCAGIHMSDIPSFSYDLLWEERVIRSVANLTRLDGEEFLNLAGEIDIKTHITVYSLEKANEALLDLKNGHLVGSAVIKITL